MRQNRMHRFKVGAPPAVRPSDKANPAAGASENLGRAAFSARGGIVGSGLSRDHLQQALPEPVRRFAVGRDNKNRVITGHRSCHFVHFLAVNTHC